MKKKILILSILIISLIPVLGLLIFPNKEVKSEQIKAPKTSHWLMLNRKSGIEILYEGVPGDANNSKILRRFQVKTGASWSPTPLPKLLGREYWTIIKKESSMDNPETAPYFLQLDIPTTEKWPYGPVPYTECLDFSGNNIQCDWILPGYFGLHGIGGNESKLSLEDWGSSGCIRHKDEDITYLFELLDPEKEEIRYYIADI
ncbi:MAG: L,D-transpeptidase [Candidatus Levybacteria bacterium]|nr:L,D-transpeptidase [Candidatus Levybacteria bacterium]